MRIWALLAAGLLTGCSSGHVRSERHSWFPVYDTVVAGDSSKCGKTLWRQWNGEKLCGLSPGIVQECIATQGNTDDIRCLGLPYRMGAGFILDTVLTPVHLMGHALTVPFRWSPADHSGQALGFGISAAGGAAERALSLAHGDLAVAAEAADSAQTVGELISAAREAKKAGEKK